MYTKKKYMRCVKTILITAAGGTLEDDGQMLRFYGEALKTLKLKTEADYLGYLADLDELSEVLGGKNIECWEDAFSNVAAYLRTEGVNPFIAIANNHKQSQLPLFN